MELNMLRIGFAVTGSFCTMEKATDEISTLVSNGAKVIPIMSEISVSTDTRFGSCGHFIDKITTVTGEKVICTIKDAEPIGPKKLLDALVVAPCTGNTMAKIAGSITDSCVTMAVKAHLRNNRPVVIAPATNDALSGSAKNIGELLNRKNIYFVPFGQDDPIKKTTSMIADFTKITDTLKLALDGIQIQPILLPPETM